MPELASIVTANSHVHLITMTAADNEAADQAVKLIGKVTDKVDVVIANAGEYILAV